MKRRTFLQTAGLLGLSLSPLQTFGINNPNNFKSRFARARLDDLALEYTPIAKEKTPQIIYMFLYGGPSELAGNLTNIEAIMLDSQNTYPAEFMPDDVDTIVTPNYFWNGAGGSIMEDLIKSGDMSIYRTLNRQIDTSRAHGECVTQNLIGNTDTNLPGIASNLAHIIANNNPFKDEKPLEDLLFPFVSFEGETSIFNVADAEVPLALRPISLNSDLTNPFSLRNNDNLPNDSENNSLIDQLAKTQNTKSARFPKLVESFNKRQGLSEQIGAFLDETTVNASITTYNDKLADGEKEIAYPNTNIGRRMKAAISLALANPETMFINLGDGGLGRWDDHSEGIQDYSSRMQGLMEAVDAAIRHIELAGKTPADSDYHANADNIIINIHGEFGRNVNLNNSQGWDHGNNQNLYTFGGKNIRGQEALGKIIGTTKLKGNSANNRLYTTPDDNSYQIEPFALAATMYKYFGVNNPEVLMPTKENGDKVTAIDEAQAGITLETWPVPPPA